tara:strand:- start:2651 stop:3727 length:1077 start_codon:yes stop_codon:yes gene_type:complete
MNYLIFKNDGIGDLIVSSDGIRRVREYDEDAYITLICSNRNIEYAKILKKDGHINRLYNLDSYNTYKKTIKLISILRKIDLNHVFILKTDRKNLFISLLCNSKNIHAIIPNKISKFTNRIIYKYPLFISKILLKSIEIINSIEINAKDSRKRMGKHYSTLFEKALSLKKSNLKYLEPNSIKQFKNKTEKLFTSLKINNQKVILFHLDEKWVDVNGSKEFIIDIFDKITNKKQKKLILIVTNGKFSTTLNKKIWNYYKINKKEISIKNNIYFSEKNKNIIFIKKSNISEIIGIVSKVNLIFHMHGSLTHIASILKTPIIDIIRNNTHKYFYKWRPNFREFKQVEIRNFTNPNKYIQKYL